ncbi:MAG TPA: hypothetical protein VFQ27_05055 [Xanthobacteraceae bacterium]|nr:hypothetical protein [Xanthobacteraceae bacterium]
MKSFLAQLLGIVAAFAAAAAVSIGWLVYLRLGPDFEGFAAGPVIFGVPAALFVLTLIWLLARGLAEGSARWNFLVVLAGAGAFAYAVVAVACGPVVCFMPGNHRLAGWFIVGGLSLAALAHHFVRERFRTK